MKISRECDVAIQAARAAGIVLMKNFRLGHEVMLKEDKSVTVQTDREAEEAILSIIRKEFPTHKILSEESGTSGDHPDYFWVVDPLDGTNNFSREIPFSGTSIALLKNDEPIAAAVYNPMLDEMFTAEKGKGTFLNGKKIRTSDKKMLSGCVMTFVRKERKPEMGEKIYMGFSRRAKSIKMIGCEAVELAYTACGRLDLRVSHGNSAWDYAAGVLLAEEAGCVVTDFDGLPWKLTSKGVIAANAALHAEALAVVKEF